MSLFACRPLSRPDTAATSFSLRKARGGVKGPLSLLPMRASTARNNESEGQTPWQVAPQPVYAVGSYRPSDGVSNLSIATYVTAASISKGRDDKKRYVVCLFKDSVTHGIVSETRQLSLSLLREYPGAGPLVELLGKTHHSPDNCKLARLENDMGIECDTVLWNGLPLLPSACVMGAMMLSVQQVMDAGDHDVFLCEVERLQQLVAAGDDSSPNPLLTYWLKEQGVL